MPAVRYFMSLQDRIDATHQLQLAFTDRTKLPQQRSVAKLSSSAICERGATIPSNV